MLSCVINEGGDTAHKHACSWQKLLDSMPTSESLCSVASASVAQLLDLQRLQHSAAGLRAALADPAVQHMGCVSTV